MKEIASIPSALAIMHADMGIHVDPSASMQLCLAIGSLQQYCFGVAAVYQDWLCACGPRSAEGLSDEHLS